MGYLVAYILGLLTAIKNPPSQKTKNSVSPTAKSEKENHSRDILLDLHPQIPPAPTNAEYTCKCCHHKAPRWKVILDWLTFLAALGAVAAAIWYACITRHMWEEMQAQTESQSRPWVGLIGIPEIVGAEGIHQQGYAPGPVIRNVDSMQIFIRLQNFGPSPAIQVFPRFKSVWVISPKPRHQDEPDLCNPPTQGYFIDSVDGIFPGREGILEKEINVGFDPVPADDVREPNYLFGCITYRRSGSSKTYWTWVIYALNREQVRSAHRKILSVVPVDVEAE